MSNTPLDALLQESGKQALETASLPTKADALNLASQSKKQRLASLSGLGDSVVTGIRTNTGGSSMSQPEYDARTMVPSEYADKYGIDAFNQLQSDVGSAVIDAENDRFINSAVTGTQQVKDLGVGIGSGAVNIGLGLAQLGALSTPYASDVAQFSKGVNQVIDSGLSDATQASRNLAQKEYAMSDRDNQQAYLDSEDTSLSNKASRELANLGDRLANVGKYGLSDTNVIGQAIGSIGGIGLITKGVAKVGSTIADKVLSAEGANVAGKVGNAIRYQTLVGATEGGSAASDAINQVLALPQSVIEQNPKYQALKNSNPELTHQQLVEELATNAGLTAAAITAPIAAGLGTLTKGFNDKAILPTAGSLKGIVANAGKETLEEVPQSITGTVGTNIGVQQNGDTSRDVLKDTGQAAYDALIGSVGSTGAMQGVSAVTGSVTEAGNKVTDRIKSMGIDSQKVENIKKDVVPKAVKAIKDVEAQISASPNPVADPKSAAHLEVTRRLAEAFTLDATKDDIDSITDSPKLREALYGTNSVPSAITRLVNFAKRTDIKEAERFDAVVNMLNFVSTTQEILSQEEDVINTHGHFAPLKEFRQAMSTGLRELIDSNLTTGLQEDVTKKLYDNALKAGYIIPTNPTNLTNPATEQAELSNLNKTINVVLQSKTLPDGFRESVSTILQMVSTGYTGLTPKQVKSLESIEALYKESKLIEEDALSIGADGTAIVNNQVVNATNAGTDIKGRQLGNRLSVRGHVNSIINALNTNDRVAYETRVKRFRAFVLEHNAKADAVDTHINKVLNNQISNNERTPYSNTITGKQGLYVNLNSPTSIKTAKTIQQEAIILSRSFARLLKAFGSEEDIKAYAIPKKLLERKVNSSLLNGLVGEEPTNNQGTVPKANEGNSSNGIDYDAYAAYAASQDSQASQQQASSKSKGKTSKEEWAKQQGILQAIRSADGVEAAQKIIEENKAILSPANLDRANKLVEGKRKYAEQQASKVKPTTEATVAKQVNNEIPKDTQASTVETPKSKEVTTTAKPAVEEEDLSTQYEKDIESGLDVLDALDNTSKSGTGLDTLDINPYSKASLLVLSEALTQDQYKNADGVSALKDSVKAALEATPTTNEATTTPTVSSNGAILSKVEYDALVNRYRSQTEDKSDNPTFMLEDKVDKAKHVQSKFNFTDEQMNTTSVLDLLNAIPSDHPMHSYAQLMIPLVKRNPIKLVSGITLPDGTKLVVNRSSSNADLRMVLLSEIPSNINKDLGTMGSLLHEVSHVLFKDFFNGTDPRSKLPQGKALVEEYHRIHKEFLDSDVKPTKDYNISYAKNPNEFYAMFFNSINLREHLSNILDTKSKTSLLGSIANLVVKAIGLGKVKPNTLETLSNVLVESLTYLYKGESDLPVDANTVVKGSKDVFSVVGSDLAFDNNNPIYANYTLAVPSDKLSILSKDPLKKLNTYLNTPLEELKATFKGLGGLSTDNLKLYKDVFNGFVPVLVGSFSGELSKATSKGSLKDEVGKVKGTGLSSIATIVASELSELTVEKQVTAIRRAIVAALPNFDLSDKVKVDELVKSFRRYTNVSAEKTLYEKTKKELEDEVTNTVKVAERLKAELESKSSDDSEVRSDRSLSEIRGDTGLAKIAQEGAIKAVEQFDAQHGAKYAQIKSEYMQLTDKNSKIMANLIKIRTELAKEFSAGNITKDTLVLRKELIGTPDGKAFAFADVEWSVDTKGNNNAKLNLNQPLVETAAIGAMQWLIYKSAINSNSYMEKSDAAEILGLSEDSVSNALLDSLRKSINTNEAVSGMSGFILDALQLKPKGGVSFIGDTQGVINSLASTFLEIMTVDSDFNLAMSELTTEGRFTKFITVLPTFGVVLEKSENGKHTFSRSIFNTTPDFISSIVAKPSKDNVFVGTSDKVPVSETLLHSDTRITDEQVEVIKKANKVAFKIHTPMLSLYNALGKYGLISIAGSLEVDPDTTNKNTLAAREGQNLQIISSLLKVEQIISKIDSYAKDTNTVSTDVEVFFPNAFVSTNRLQQDSSFSPQASKVTRAVISATIRDVDLTDPDANKLFHIAIAQGMGVKVHNLSYENVTKELNKILSKPEVKEAVRALRDIESKNSASEKAILKLKEAYPSLGNTLWGLSSLVEYKRFKDTEANDPKSLKSFRTNAAIEADGMTNGTANALHVMHGFELSEGDVTNWMRTGFYIGNEGTTANAERTKDSTDIYSNTSKIMEDKFLEYKDIIISGFREKLAGNVFKKYTAKVVTNLINKGGLDLMYSFIEEFSPNVSIDKEKGTLTLKRNFSKQPVTVVVYGASTGTMVEYIVKDILDNIYESMSDHLSGKNVWSQAKVNKFNAIIKQLGSVHLTYNIFTGMSVKYRQTKEGKFDPNPYVPQVSLANPDSFKNFSIEGSTAQFLSSNMAIIIGLPLETTIKKVLGTGLMFSMENIIKATSLHSMILSKAFNKAVKDTQLTDLSESSKASIGKFIKVNSLKELTDKVNNTYKGAYVGNNQTFYIADKEGRSDIVNTPIGASLGGKFSSYPKLKSLVRVGVKGAPVLNIGNGDASMIQRYIANLGNNINALYVYDGVEFSIADIMEQSVNINKSVFDTWTQNNVPKQVVKSYLEAIKNLTPDLVDFQLASYVAMSKNEDIKSYQDVVDYLQHLGTLLSNMSDRIDSKQAKLLEYGSTVHQMASVEAPYVHKGDKFQVNTPKGIAEELNGKLPVEGEEDQPTSLTKLSNKDTTTPSIGSETDAKPVSKDSMSNKLARNIHEFVADLDAVVDIKSASDKRLAGLVKRLAEANRSTLNDTQIIVAKDTQDAIRLAGESGLLNETELEDFTKVISKNETNALYMFPANFVMVLQNKGTLTSVAHELIHAATFLSLRKAYRSGDVDQRTREGKILSILEKLMQEFTSDGFKDFAKKSEQGVSSVVYSDVVGIISEYLQQGKKAEAMAEFMAYVLSDKALSNLAKERKGEYGLAKAAKAVIAYVKSILGIPSETTIFNNMLDSLEFHTLVLSKQDETSTGTNNDNAAILEQRNLSSTSTKALLDKAFSKLSILKNSNKKKSINVLDKIDLAIESNLNAADSLVKLGFHMDSDSKKLYSLVSGLVTANLLTDSSVLNRLSKLYQHAITDLTIDDFMSDGVTDDQARDMYNSLLAASFSTKSGNPFARFVGLLAASKPMQEAISKLNFNKVTTKVSDYDSLINRSGEYILGLLDTTKLEGNGGSIAHDLIIELLSTQESNNYFGNVEHVLSTINKMNQSVAEYITATIPSISRKLSKVGSTLHPVNPIGIIANVTTVGLSFLNKQLSGEISRIANSKMDRVSKWEPARDLLSDLIGRTTDNAHIYDLIKPIKTFVAKTRQTYRTEVPNKLLRSFVNPVTSDELALMTRVIADTGLHHLGSSRAVDLLTGDITVESVIDSSLDVLGKYYSNDELHYIFSKVTQLAKYAVTHDAGDHLLRNAYAIANLLGSGFDKPSLDFNKSQSRLIVNTINNLVAVSALDYISDEDKANMVKVISNNKEGILTTLDYMTTIYHKDTAKILASDSALYNHYYGYLNKSKIDSSELLVMPSSHQRALELQGFTYIGDYYGDSRDSLDVPLGYYYRDVSPNNIFTQGLVQNIDSTVAGVNATTGLSESGIVGLVLSEDVIADITNNPYVDTSESLIPVYTNSGILLSYERSISNTVRRLTEYETDITKILGATRGRQVEEIAASYWNHKLVDTLNLDYASSVNKQGYVDILDPKAFVNDPVNKDAVAIFSNAFTDMIKNMGTNHLYVKRELIREVIGYRKASITDVFTGKSRLNPATLELIKSGLISVFGRNAFKYVTYAENTLVEGVQTVRTIIAIKSIVVPIANILGNLLHLASTSVNMVKGVKRIPMFVQEVEEYSSNQRRIVDIEVEMATTQDMYALRKLKSELEALNQANSRMKIAPLIEAGELSGLNDAGYLDRDWEFLKGVNKDIKTYIEKVIEHTPDSLISFGKQLLVTKDTALYNGLQKTVMYGDFIAKAILYYDLIDKGVSVEDATARIQEEFVNYDKLSGRTRDALESYGLLWFYNFKLRSIKIALNMLRNNPLHTLLIGLGISEPLNLGTAFTDNAIGLAIEGNLSYSIGADMAINGFSLNPYYALIN